MKNKKDIVIYQAKSGRIEFKGDVGKETIWGNLNQIATLFGRDKSVISRHIKSIFKSRELNPKSVVAKIATTASDGKIYQVDYYNLDVILSVGYRVDSKRATQFRIWATKTLKQHLLQGYTIDKKLIGQNYKGFMRAVSEVKALLPKNDKIENKEILELVNTFASTWFSLNAYDENNFPQKIHSKKRVKITSEELVGVLQSFKKELKAKKQASNLFGQENNKGVVQGIVGNVFQSFNGKNVYQSLEEKAAHLLYFMIKNHPFVDGNKRSGAFSFIWFLQKAGILRASITPEALTALTILIAESNPKEKDRIIGLILLLIKRNSR